MRSGKIRPLPSYFTPKFTLMHNDIMLLKTLLPHIRQSVYYSRNNNEKQLKYNSIHYYIRLWSLF